MPKKIKYILTALVFISLVLSSTGCSLSLPWAPTPAPSTPAPAPPSNPTEHTNPNWTFPSGSSQTSTPLPNIALVVKKAMPSVVSVTTEMVAYDILHQEYTQPAAGSGVIIDDAGYVITNNHVIKDAKNIKVQLNDGRTFPADIVGADALTDLAVLKIKVPNLPYASLGDSSQLAVGNWVIAIGNAMGEGVSASEGIVSRLNVSVTVEGNTLYGLIQTTAAINPGNSGGPLVNMSGEVVGITSVKMAAIRVEGMGYAISTTTVKPIIEDLIHQGYVTRPWLGVGLYTVDSLVARMNNLSIDKGALITKLCEHSPADASGLQEGDVIIRFAGKEINNCDDLVQAIGDSQIGQNVEITFVRGEDTKTTSAQLTQSPPPWG